MHRARSIAGAATAALCAAMVAAAPAGAVPIEPVEPPDPDQPRPIYVPPTPPCNTPWTAWNPIAPGEPFGEPIQDAYPRKYRFRPLSLKAYDVEDYWDGDEVQLGLTANYWFPKWGPRYIEAGERLHLHCVTEWTFTSHTVVDLFEEDDLFDADDFLGRLLIDPTLADGQVRTHQFRTEHSDYVLEYLVEKL